MLSKDPDGSWRDGSWWDDSWRDGSWRDGSWRDGSPSNKSRIPRKSASETSQCGKRVASVTWKTAQDHVNNLHNQTNSTDSLGTLAQLHALTLQPVLMHA